MRTMEAERRPVRSRRARGSAMWAVMLVGLLVFPSGGDAVAETIAWSNPGGGPWFTAGNWNPQDVPNEAGEVALFAAGGGSYAIDVNGSVGLDAITNENPGATIWIHNRDVTVTEAAGFLNAGTVVCDVSGGILRGRLENLAGAVFEVRAGVSRELRCPAILNDGAIRINPTGAATGTVLYVGENAMDLEGTGELVLHTSGNPAEAWLRTSGGSLVQAAGHTIRGDGRLSLPWVNHGLIVADVGGRQLLIDGDYSKRNDGTLAATNGGVLQLAWYPITQGADGLILADGGIVELRDHVDITGGSFNTANSGAIRVANNRAYLRAFRNLGQLEVPSYREAYFYGPSITNDGTIMVNPTQGPGTYVYFADGEVSLTGTGQIRVQTDGDPYNARLVAYNGGRLVQTAGHTIRGEGMIAVGLRNEGLVSADVAGRVLLLNSVPKTNNAVLQATGGGILALTTGGAVTQGSNGLILADGGTVELRVDADIRGGDLNTANGGVIRVATSASYLREIHNRGQLDLPNNTTTYCYGPTLSNDGTITVNSDHGARAAYLYVADGEVALGGTGQVVLQTNGDPYTGRLSPYNGGSLVQAAGHTIRGEGMISAGFRNDGTVAGDVAGRTLILNGDAKTNQGTVRAANGGTVNVTSPFLNQGTAEAASGGTFRLENLGAHYGGGTLTGGAWQVLANSTMRLIGANVTTLAAGVLLDGANSNLCRDDGSASALAGLSTIANGGRLEIRNGRDFTSAGALTTNRGTVVIGPGSTLGVNGSYEQHGFDQTGLGQLWVDGTLDPTGAATIHGGILGGSGTIQASVQSGGRVNPGSSVGTLTIAGSYTQADSGALYIELSPQGSDHLTVTGSAHLAGRIWIESVPGYEPAPGDTFQVLSCAARDGEFTGHWGCPGVGLQYRVYYYPTHVTIEIYGDPSAVEHPEVDVPAVDAPAAEWIPTELQLWSCPAAAGHAFLRLELPVPADVELSLYDLSGRRVALLGEGAAGAGFHDYRWDGRSAGGRLAGSGVYLARARVRGVAAAGERVARVLLVR